ncbi:MAG: phosphatase PAP2 family protein, partial [Rhizobiales bacterium]|nr:phosphatase PAP2 family protein [Hyphomicrobiales bacterium]
IILAMTLAFATAANLGLKLMFAKPRPPADESHIAVFTLSYPSGHALMTGVLAGALALLATASGTTARRMALACAVLTTLLVGLSRIRLGAHWPTDVIAGWLTALALTSALAAWLERAR